MATHLQYSCLGNPMDRAAWPWSCKESDAKEHTHILIIQHHRGKNMIINVDFPSFGKAFRKKK